MKSKIYTEWTRPCIYIHPFNESSQPRGLRPSAWPGGAWRSPMHWQTGSDKSGHEFSSVCQRHDQPHRTSHRWWYTGTSHSTTAMVLTHGLEMPETGGRRTRETPRRPRLRVTSMCICSPAVLCTCRTPSKCECWRMHQWPQEKDAWHPSPTKPVSDRCLHTATLLYIHTYIRKYIYIYIYIHI